MRNPKSPAWPDGGEPTGDREVAERWRLSYWDLVTGAMKRRALGRHTERGLKNAVDAWLRHREKTVERGTHQNDRSALGHLLDYLGDVQLSAIAQSDVQSVFDRLAAQGYAPTTLKVYAGAVGVFAKHLGLDWALRTPNPGQHDIETLDDAQVEALLVLADAVDAEIRADWRWRLQSGAVRLAVELGLFMGLRQGEIFGLHWDDLRADERAVRVQRQLPKDGTRTKPLKGKRARTAVVLPGWWETDRDGEGVVIATPDGRYVGTRTQRNIAHRLGIGWHILRHTYCRTFLELVPETTLLQKSLGHASVTITENAYGHLLPDRAAQLASQRIYGPQIGATGSRSGSTRRKA